MTTAISIVDNVKGLSKKELGVLMHLRSNARHTVTQIGRKLGIPRTTVFEKIKKFKRLGLVPRFTAIIDFNKLGLSICAYVLFKTEPSQKEALGEALAKSMHTNNVAKLGNDYDYMASLVFENMNDMHIFLDLLVQKYAVRETKIMYITQDVKREGIFAQYQKPGEMESSAEEGEEL